MTPEIAEILGICMGDGCISITKRYWELAICGDIKEERPYYDTVIAPLLNENVVIPTIGEALTPGSYPKLGVYGIITFNKRIVETLLSFGLKPSPKIHNGVPKEVIFSEADVQKAFLRGIFDTDGSIFFRKNYSARNPLHRYPKIKIGSVSKSLMIEIYAKNMDLKRCKGVTEVKEIEILCITLRFTEWPI